MGRNYIKCNSSIIERNLRLKRAKSVIVRSALISSLFILGSLPSFAQNTHSVSEQKILNLRGKVIDNTGEILIGASVRVKGTTQGVVTDAKGLFFFPKIASNAVLEVSYVGMKTQTIRLNGRSQISVRLEEDGQLEQVVVTGYQKVKRERMTGSVSTISSADFKNLNVKSVDQLLKGTISGVQTIASGRPGQDARIRIRGINSLNGNASPIWIIDGMPLQGEAPDIAASGDLEAMLYQSGIGNIPPDDIESVTVLKDAAASAIYGARAANGVIVVTTKRGKEGPTRYNVTAHFGLTERPQSNVQMMNTEQKIRFEKQIYNDYGNSVSTYGRITDILSRIDKGVLSQSEGDKEIARLSTINTDWFQELYKPAFNTQINVTLSGGSARTKHYTSLNLTSDEGTELNYLYRRLYVGTKLDHALSKRLNLQTNLTVSYRTTRSTASSIKPLDYALYANPYEHLGDYDQSWDMSYSRIQSGYAFPRFNAKEDLLNNTNNNKKLEATLISHLEWETPLEGLKLKGQGVLSTSSSNANTEIAENGYTSYRSNWLNGRWAYSEVPLSFVRGSLEERSYTHTSYAVKAQGEYSRVFSDLHHVNLLAGAEASHSVSYDSRVYFPTYDKLHRVVGYPELVEGTDLKKIPFDRLGGTGKYERKAASLYFNATYAYDDRYVLSSSLRYDGSDVIGNENQFTPLWNVSGRWNLHQEKWFKNEVINFLSLRLGYGLTGSIDRSALPYVVMTFTDSDIYDGVTTPSRFNYANPSIKWQTKHDFNVGLDLALWKDRIRLGVNYYYNTVNDLLDSRVRPYSSGVSQITQNVSSLVNKGWELDLSATILRRGSFSWSVRGSLALNTNKITKTYYASISDLPQNYSSSYPTVQGYPQGGVFAYRFAGIDPKTGNVLAWDANGKTFDMDLLRNKTLKLQAPEISYIGPGEPPITGGFSTSVHYKRWVLDASFEFMAGHYIPTFNRFVGLGSGNRHVSDEGRWRTAGDIATRPQIGYIRTAYTIYPFDVNYEKGDYLRASYMSLGYNLPSKLIEKIGLQALRLSFTANNLFTFSRYRGIDPSLMGAIGYPNSRKYSVSLNVSF